MAEQTQRKDPAEKEVIETVPIEPEQTQESQEELLQALQTDLIPEDEFSSTFGVSGDEFSQELEADFNEPVSFSALENGFVLTDHVISGLATRDKYPSPEEAFSAPGIRNIIEDDKIERIFDKEKRITDLTNSIQSKSHADLHRLVDEIKQTSIGNIGPRTVGQIYADKSFPSAPSVFKQGLGELIDARVYWQQDKDLQAAFTEQKDYKDIFNIELNLDFNIPKSIREDIKKLPAEAKTPPKVDGAKFVPTPDPIGTVPRGIGDRIGRLFEGLGTATTPPGLAELAVRASQNLPLVQQINQLRKLFSEGALHETPSTPAERKEFEDRNREIEKDFLEAAKRIDKSVFKDLDRLRDKQRQNINDYGPVGGTLLNSLEFVQFGIYTAAHFPTRIIEQSNPDSTSRVRNVYDWISWVSMVPTNPDMEVDVLRVWNSFVDGSWDEASELLDRQMTDRYGDDWHWRALALIVKEIGVDAMLYASGKFNSVFRETMEAAVGKKFFSKEYAKAIAARAMVIGVGGGVVQAGMNKFVGQPAELFDEVVIRTLGELVGEGVFGLGRVALRTFFREGGRRIAEEVGAPLLNKFADNVARGTSIKVPKLVTLLRQATIYYETKELRRVAGDVAEAIVNNLNTPGNEALKSRLSKLTGLLPEELETHVVEAHRIFGNINLKPEFTKAQQRLLRSQRILRNLEEEEEIKRNSIKNIRDQLKNADPDDVDKIQKRLQKAEIRLQDLVSRRKAQNLQVNNRKSKILEFEELGGVSSGSDMADMVATGQALSFRTVLQDAMENNQQSINDLIIANVDLLNKINFRDSLDIPGFPKIPFGRFISRFMEPEEILGVEGKNIVDAWNLKSRWAAFNRELVRRAFRNVGPQQTGRVWRALRQGGIQEKIWSTDELTEQFFLNQRGMDAYYSMRKVLDMGHLSLDNILTRELTKDPDKVKVLLDGRAVEILETLQDDVVKYRVIPRTADEVVEEGTVKSSELRPLVSALHVERGYIPIVYKNAKYHVSALNLDDGTMNRVFAGPNRVQALEFQRAAQRTIDDEGKNIIYIADAWDDITKEAAVAFPRRGVKLMDAMGDEGAANFRKALLTAESDIKAKFPDMDPDVAKLRLDKIKVFLDNFDYTSLRRKFIGERGQRLVGDFDVDPVSGKLTKTTEADQVYTEQAVAEYLNHVALRAGMADWRQHAIDTFMSIYGPGGPKQVLLPGERWDSALKDLRDRRFVKVAGKERSIGTLDHALEAKMMQQWLNRTIKGKTWFEESWDLHRQAVINRWSESDHPVARSMSKVLDSLAPTAQQFLNAARITGAAPKLLFYNVAQVIVQGSQTMATIGSRLLTKPHLIPLAIGDTLNAIAAAGQREARLPLAKAQRRLLDAHIKSGYFSELTTNDVVELMGIKKPSFATYHDKHGALGAAVRQARDLALARPARTAYNWGTWPFKSGEALNRLMAFNLTRREMISEFKRGKLLNLDGTGKFTGQIDDHEFLQKVIDKAKVTALNMNKAGQLEITSGLGSVMFQFKQVLPKEINLFFKSSALSGREKFGAAVGFIGTFGPTAIPLFYDMWAGAEWAVWQLFTNKEPSKREVASQIARDWATDVLDYTMGADPDFWRMMGIEREDFVRLVRKGALNALTDGEIDIVNRVGLGKFLTDSVEMWEWTDATVFTSVVSDALNAFVEGRDGSPSIWTIWERLIENEVTPDQALAQGLTSVGKVVSFAGSWGRFLESINPAIYDANYDPFQLDNRPRIKSSTGRDTGILSRDPTRGNVFGVNLGENRVIQFLFGLTPGPVVDQIEMRKKESAYKKAIARYLSFQARNYRQARTPEGKRRIQAETITELYDTQHLVHSLGFTDIPIIKYKQWIHRQVFSRFLVEDFKFRNPFIFGLRE